MVRMAIDRGVTIAMGTDLGLTGLDLPGAWGTNGTELAHLVALGMTPRQAIEAATATAPRTLGPQAPRSGLLAEGYDADSSPWTGTRWPISPCSRSRITSPRCGSADARSKAVSDSVLTRLTDHLQYLFATNSVWAGNFVRISVP